MGAEKLKEKIEAFNRSKQGFEESKAATLIRRGRIDVFDEVRSALSNWWDSLGQEKDLIRQMQEMFDCLHAGIRRAIKNETEYAPQEDPKIIKAYNEAFRDFLDKAIKANDYTNDGFREKFWESTSYNKMNSAISGDFELEEKAKEAAEKRQKAGVPNGSGKNGWAKVLAHGIENKNGAESELKKAKSEISKLSGGKSKTVKFQESMDALKGPQGYDEKLRRFGIRLLWAARDTDANMEQISKTTGSSNPIKNDGENDKKKHNKKIKKFHVDYAKLVNEALDILIDVRDSVDSDNQAKVITPREKNIYIGLQKVTGKNWDLVREAEKEVAKASGGRQRSNAITM